MRGTQSGVLNLGMTYSVPIIAANVGGFSTSLSNYELKILIEPNDENSLVSAMNTMIQRILSSSDKIRFDFRNAGNEVNQKYINKITTFALLPTKG